MKPNWPLIGIIVAAVVTVGIVVLIFVSTATTATHSGLPTTVALSKVSANTVEKNVTVEYGDDDCVFVVVDGVKSFAIWPEGYTKDTSGNVVAPDGTPYGKGGAFLAATIVTSRQAVLKLDGGGDDGYLGTLMTRCQGSGTPVAIITAIDG
ncbi:hypothetical protein BH11ACT2_BH11ACT2_21180 [soil metagenome]